MRVRQRVLAAQRAAMGVVHPGNSTRAEQGYFKREKVLDRKVACGDVDIQAVSAPSVIYWGVAMHPSVAHQAILACQDRG